MPAETKSMELVTVGISVNGQPTYSYREYQGSPLKQIAAMETRMSGRVHHLLSQRAAVMP